MVSQCKSELMLVFFSHHSPFAVLIDFISMARIWEQLLFNIRWLIYYLWWSIAPRNSHFSFLHHMSEANASYLEWNGKCFIAEWNGLPRRNEMKTGAASAVFALLRRAKSEKASFRHFFGAKKWRLAFLFPPAILNCILSLKTQNFAVK